MTLAERQAHVVNKFAQITDWEERYKRIIQMGQQLAAYPDEFRSDDFKVKGCQSQVWLHAHLNDQKQVILQADSDALIVKGLVAVLIEVYSGSTPGEILGASVDFLKQMGLENHLSPSRSNGLYSMLKQIMYYATAFQFMLKQ
jgi:cysteine desulfuration protein SufE